MSCPCHSGLDYEICCKPYHEGECAPSAYALMRSRYSAYAKGLIDYIIKTTRPKERKGLVFEDLEAFSRQTTFKDLQILKVEEGERFSYVTFKAVLFVGDQDTSFTERSLFEKISTTWYYAHP